MKLYIAGKVNKNSHFGTSHWRDGFVDELVKISGLQLSHLDPLAYEGDGKFDPGFVFDKDCWLISQADCVIVYLSDDISVGGSQEMLIAKYFGKPLIGLAPREGKFNKSVKEHLGHKIENYVDPFVFSVCDIVCSTVSDVANTLTSLPERIKTLDIIQNGADRAATRLKTSPDTGGVMTDKGAYNKLVRDKIPEIIVANGEEPVYRVLDGDEYRQALLDKLVEEAKELREANGDMSERVDVAEVLRALDDLLGYSADSVESACAEKARKRGGFQGRIFLEGVSDGESE